MIEKILLLNKKPNNNPILIISLFIFIITIAMTYKFNTYDAYKSIGILECDEICAIKTNIPYDKLSILKKEPQIIYNDNPYSIIKIEYGEIYIENAIPYQEVLIYLDTKEESKLLEFTINYNKQRIYKKIIDIIKGD